MGNALVEFYPTPKTLIDKMLDGIDFNAVKTVLEPSAGNGAIVEGLLERSKQSYRGEEIDIDVVEIEPDLQKILKGKGYKLVYDDFLTFEADKHYDLIIMNPPFSNGDKHLLKALEMQENGGEVIAIVNAETIRNPFSNRRKELVKLLEEYNAEINYLPSEFTSADRTTNVEVAMIKAKVPCVYKSDILKNLERSELEQEDRNFEPTDVASGNYFQNLIDSYNLEVAAGKKLITEYFALKPRFSSSFKKDSYQRDIIKLEVNEHSYKENYGEMINRFIYSMRYKYWNALFHSDEFMKLFTSKLRQDFMSKLSEMKYYDFNLFNVLQMRIELSRHLLSALEDNILQCFEEFSTKYSWYSECANNIHYYNGWAHNKAHYVNKKVIIPLSAWNDIFKRFSYYRVEEKLKDIERVFEYLDGSDRINYHDLSSILKVAENMGESRNIELKYFNVSFYKKGTCHIEFTDEKLLKKFNIYAGRQKNWLPPHYGKKAYNEMTDDEKAVIDEFEGEQAYEEVYEHSEQYLIENNELLKLCG